MVHILQLFINMSVWNIHLLGDVQFHIFYGYCCIMQLQNVFISRLNNGLFTVNSTGSMFNVYIMSKCLLGVSDFFPVSFPLPDMVFDCLAVQLVLIF